MSNLIESITFAAGQNIEAIVFVIDVLIRSAVLLFLFNWCLGIFDRHLSPHILHRALFLLLIYLGLLPFLPLLLLPLLGPGFPNALFVLLIPDTQMNGANSGVTIENAASLLILVYVIGLLFCLARLIASLHKLRKLKHAATYEVSAFDQQVLSRLETEFGLNTRVILGTSDEIDSPSSFGFTEPVVLVPETWNSWGASTRINILRHELAHIRRGDWLTSLIADAVSYLSWPNPFVFRVKKQMRAASEQACDLLVLEGEVCEIDYAEQLLMLARCAGAGSSATNLCNTMVSTGDLTERVEAILESRGKYEQSRPVTYCLIGLCLSVLIIPATFNALAIEDARQFKIPRVLYSERPVYNPSYFAHGYRGLTRLRYDVDAEGNVDPESIFVVYTSNHELVATPAIEALKKFKFEPRVVRGQPTVTRGLESDFNLKVLQATSSIN